MRKQRYIEPITSFPETTPNIETITMSFGDFIKSRHEGIHNLYIVWNDTQPIYVGISASGLWNRWFSSRNSHMSFAGLSRKLTGWSTIGKEVANNLPKSLKWKIELRYYGVWNNQDLANSERLLIQELHPMYNTIYNY